jgi:hypothetical protein
LFLVLPLATAACAVGPDGPPLPAIRTQTAEASSDVASASSTAQHDRPGATPSVAHGDVPDTTPQTDGAGRSLLGQQEDGVGTSPQDGTRARPGCGFCYTSRDCYACGDLAFCMRNDTALGYCILK